MPSELAKVPPFNTGTTKLQQTERDQLLAFVRAEREKIVMQLRSIGFDACTHKEPDEHYDRRAYRCSGAIAALDAVLERMEKTE